MSKCQVVHKNFDTYDIYIGRGSPYGNYVGKNLPKSEAISVFEKQLLNDEELLSRLPFLIGKRLGCYCRRKENTSPKCICHGDILAKYTNRLGHPFHKTFTQKVLELHRNTFPNSKIEAN